jgi:hypothetical protein
MTSKPDAACTPTVTERAVAVRLQCQADATVPRASVVDSRIIRATSSGWVEIRAVYLQHIIDLAGVDRA